MWELQRCLCQSTAREKRKRERAAGIVVSILRKIILRAFQILSIGIYRFFKILATPIQDILFVLFLLLVICNY